MSKKWCEFAESQCLTHCGVVLFTIAPRFSLVCADLHLQSGMRCYSYAPTTVLGAAAMAGRRMTTVASGPASFASLLAIAAVEFHGCECILRTPLHISQMRESVSFFGAPRSRWCCVCGCAPVCVLESWGAVRGAVCDWCRPLFTHPTAGSNLYNKGLTGPLPLSWGNALEYVTSM